MTKTPKYKKVIEQNRETITKMLSGDDTVKRLNNLNWLRHEIAYNEPRILFYIPAREQLPYLDYNSMRNLGEAYDYIINNPQKTIDMTEICKVHSILCHNTYIQGGIFRTTPKILEINVNGHRMHTPDASQILSRMNEIVFKINNTEDTLNRAFNAHYDLIALQPFDDFNKRTSRLIMNWILVQGGYRPIVFNQPTDKQKYKDAIIAMASGNYKQYASYLSACMVRTQREIINLLKTSKTL